ncbi:MAG: phosphoribosylanthranilate isomerase [Paraprevotella sp.]|nr:phosphoribosylanthranilate isomerase [Paraprevotella sp.]MBP3472756.1 phosphoribosylanthranilate isomerase [Paraprevotella sp.]
MNKIVKVCGMTEADNIRQVDTLGVSLIGFIFYPTSPRCLCQLPQYLPVLAKRVGVFVNESKENVLMYADRFGLDYVQLHGNESPGYCRSLRSLGIRIIKAFSIISSKDLLATSDYEGFCDYYLFDTPTVGYGGSGQQFDWNLLQSYNGDTPFLLSGGINSGSVKALNEFHHPRMAGIDINSCFETSPGIKDAERIERFLKELGFSPLNKS